MPIQMLQLLSRRHTRVAVTAYLLLLVSGCDKLMDQSKYLNSSEYQFPGVEDLTADGDGHFSLSWEQVPADNVTYMIYSRTSDKPYNFRKADDSVAALAWKTPDLSFSPNTCYIVRYKKPDVSEDTNTNEKCTNHKLVEFAGLNDLASNGDGTWTLSWTSLAVSDLTYRIYKRSADSSYDYSKPYIEQKEAIFKTEDLSFAGNTCFVVRYNKTNTKADTNEKEICTNSNALTFAGLDKIDLTEKGAPTLKWTKLPQSNVTYNIYRTTTAGSYNFSSPWQSLTDVASYNAPAYALDQKYCYLVRYSKASLPADTNTQELCPSLGYISGFAGISAGVSNSTASATISWSAPTSGSSDVASYRVYSGSGFIDLKGTAAAGTTSLTVSNLPVDQTIAFGVRAVDSYGREDSNTTTIDVTITNNATPTFTGLTAATQVSGQKSVSLSWVAADGFISQYKIYYGVGASGSTPSVSYTTPFATTNGTTLSKTITGLGDDLSYCFDVRAVSSGGQESTTANVKCVTIGDLGAPAFAGITSAQFSAGGAQITWTASSDQVTSYYVYYAVGSSINFATASYQIVTNPSPPATQKNSASVLGLADSTTYTFAVRALDKNGVADSNTAIRTATSGDLTPPVFLGVTSISAIDDTHISVTFNRSTESDVDHYSIQIRQTSLGGSFTESTTVAQPSGTPATVTATISSLIPATSYDILVKAVDTSNNTSTNTLSTTRATLDLTPPTFSGLTSVALDPLDQSKVKVSWSAASDANGIVGYRIYYSTASLSGCASALRSTYTHPKAYTGCTANVSISTLVASGTSYSFAGLSEGSTYYFIVHAFDNSDVNNEDTNTVSSAFNVPFYTPPAAPSSVSIVGGNGPSSNNAITVTGTAVNGNTVKIYVNNTFNTQQVLNSGTTFSIPVVLSNTQGTYAITTSQVNLSSLEGPQSTAVNYQLLNSAPTATLTGTPCTPNSCLSSANALAVTVAGSNVASYSYLLLYHATSVSTTCAAANAGSYSSWTSVSTQITNSLTVNGDGAYRLCVMGKDGAGNAQAQADATQFDFSRSTVPPAAPTISSIKDPITNSTTESYNGAVSVTVGTVTGASKYCAKAGTSAPSTPASNDSCWSTSTSLSAALSGANPTGATATTTANSIYAWAMDSAQNISSMTTSGSTINYVNICSSGSLATTCTVSANRTLASGGATIGGAGSLVIAPSTTLSGAAIGDTTTLTLSGDLTVQNTGKISANISVTAANIYVNAGGQIVADSLGTPPLSTGNGSGSGAGVGQASTSAAGDGGGGYGGAGGAGSNYSGGSAYGSASSPTQFGSSGGSNGATAAGGYGGGAIKLVASGTTKIAGTISSNGGNPGSSWAGGGAGGSIWIVTNTFDPSGQGTLSVKGGALPQVTQGAGGGGGGGRISLTSTNPFYGTINVSGGLGSNYNGSNGAAGDSGSLYTNYTSVCDSGSSLSSTCTVSSAITLGDNYSISGTGNLVVANGGVLQTYRNLGSVSIAMTGNVTVQSGGQIKANISNLSAANVTIQSGAVVTADGLGYLASLATGDPATYSASSIAGKSSYGGTVGCGGGAHGGYGGNGLGSVGHGGSGMGAETVAGSNTAPTSYGGAGGTATANGILPQFGGAGGGAIKITVTSGGTLTVDGTLSANGAAGSSGGSIQGGAGAGGSLQLNTDTIAGSGSISATGGTSLGVGGTVFSGGGGGGRISLTSTNKFNGTISVVGGAAAGSGSTAGLPGYASFTNADNYCSIGALSSGTCTIGRAWRLNNGDSISGANMIITNGGSIQTLPTEKITLSLTGNLTVSSGGNLYTNLTNLVAVNVTVDNGGGISANGLGFGASLNASGSGGGPGGVGGGSLSYPTCCTSNSGGGGGHGGAGGNGSYNTGQYGFGGTSYGSSTAPTTMGSAGGSSAGSVGGDGGGSITITASGTVTVNGTISALGTAGKISTSYPVGGGAGGSIRITCSTLSGAGFILADGGNGPSSGGGGGGGRIALTRSSDTFTGTKTASGGTSGGNAGAAGTVVLQ